MHNYFLLFFLLLSTVFSADLKITQTHKGSKAGTIDGKPFLYLTGTHYERGYAMGFLAAKEILIGINGYVYPIFKMRGAPLTNRGIKYMTGSMHWDERFETEMKGILDGIKAALKDPKERLILAKDREISLVDIKLLNCLPDWASAGCSSFVRSGDQTKDGKMIIGRNLDYPMTPAMLKCQYIIASQPTEKDLKPTLNMSWVGIVGSLTTINSDGVFMAIHDAKGLARDNSVKAYHPRMLALRQSIEGASQENSLNHFQKSLESKPPRVGNNILVVAPEKNEFAVFEWDSNAKSNGVTVRKGKDRIDCTNHFNVRFTKTNYAWSIKRLTYLTGHTTKVDIEAAKDMLRNVSNSTTAHSVVYHPASGNIHYAYPDKAGASAAKCKWYTVKWTDFFPEK